MDSSKLKVVSSDLLPWRGSLKRVRSIPSDDEGWLILDPWIRPMSNDGSLCANSNSNSNSKKTVTISSGDSISVSLRAVPLPGISRLYLDLRPKPKSAEDESSDESSDESEDDMSDDSEDYRKYKEEGSTSKQIPIAVGFSPEMDPKVLAAHRNHILLRLIVPLPIDDSREEFFIYQAHTGSITSLPFCGHDFIINGVVSNTGILIHESSGELAVAHLAVRLASEIEDSSQSPGNRTPTAELCISLNGGNWFTEFLPIIHTVNEGPELYWWVTDAVLSFGDFICWVDYLRGILFCNVFSPNREVRYTRLPVPPYMGYEHPELRIRGSLSIFRNVSVTKQGLIMFVDVASSELWFSDKNITGNAITCWTLGSDQLTWNRDGTLPLCDFFAQAKAMHLPCMDPQLPLVDMEYPNVIYFVLGDEPCCHAKTCRDGKKFVIAVNMLSKTIDMSSRYNVRSTSLGGPHDDKDDDKTSYNLNFSEPFVPFEASKYLGQPGCA